MAMRCTTKTPIGEELRTQFGSDYIESFGFAEVDLASKSGELLPESNVTVLRESISLEPRLVPRGLLTTLIVCELKREYTNEQIQEKCRSTLTKECIQSMQREENGPSIVHKSKLKNYPSSSLGGDKGSWNAKLGDKFRFSISQIEGKHRHTQKFLTVFTDQPVLERELCQFAQNKAAKNVETPYTLGEFARSMQYTKAKELAQRNAQRVAAKLAAVMGLEIETQEDALANDSAKVDHATKAIVYEKPVQAVPLGLSMFNHLDSFTYARDRAHFKAVGIYNGCGSIASTMGNPVFPINPFDGIGLVAELRAEAVAGTPFHTATTLGTTLPLGGINTVNLQREYDMDDQRYIKGCLVGADCEPLSHTAPKLGRNYPKKQAVMGTLQESLPKTTQEIRVMWHTFSVV